MSMPPPKHSKQTIKCVNSAIITVSDTRTTQTDSGGQLIGQLLTGAGHAIYSYEILADDPAQIAAHVEELCDDTACHAVLLTGGTGLAGRDTTYEAIAGLLDKRLDGFGELFRMLSFEQVRAAAMLSRAVGGLRNRTAVFAMPGSPNAVRLAMEKLIIPELGHIAWLAQH